MKVMSSIRKCGVRVACDFCKKCRFFDPVFRKNELFSENKHIMTDIEFYCNHVEICENLIKMLEEENV